MYTIMNLHNTLLMVTSLCTVFTTLVTVQRYIIPISALTIFIIVRLLVTWYTSLTIIVELILPITYLLSVKLLPSALLQSTDGTGTPLAVQVIVRYTSENIHLPLKETEEIMDLTVFATLQRLHQFINFASFLHDCHLATYK